MPSIDFSLFIFFLSVGMMKTYKHAILTEKKMLNVICNFIPRTQHFLLAFCQKSTFRSLIEHRSGVCFYFICFSPTLPDTSKQLQSSNWMKCFCQTPLTLSPPHFHWNIFSWLVTTQPQTLCWPMLCIKFFLAPHLTFSGVQGSVLAAPRSQHSLHSFIGNADHKTV